MSDFGVVNGAYKSFFGINPPPRACVGAKLPLPCRVQVNCVAMRNGIKGVKPRKTLHVQGMSYWAPANIGPYSQATEDTPAPLLAICMPSLPKGAQVEWQAMLHHEKVYAEKQARASASEDDGNDTDDDDMYTLEKRALCPTTLTLQHKSSGPTQVSWKSTTQSWFLSPLLTVLSVVSVPQDTLTDMMAMMIQAVDRVLENHKSPKIGPGVEGGWKDVVGLTLYYQDTLVRQQDICQLQATFATNLETFVGLAPTKQELSNGYLHQRCKGIAVTFVPVQAIAGHGILALTAHAVGTMPTVPGLLQQYYTV
ncbi:hypothetical protein BGZ94_007161 [Podila epigama]|nr:hypothetical protein BGZ94_007161 [Podila epigama]